MASQSDPELEVVLVRYCAEHPNAADTVFGVQRWWLGDPAIPLAEVEAALEALVKRGLLARRSLPDGTVIYFNRASRDQAD